MATVPIINKTKCRMDGRDDNQIPFDGDVKMSAGSALAAGLRTLDIEERALGTLRDALGAPPLSVAFERLAAMIAVSAGRVIVTGMGKSGLVARRIAATLASTGTPAFFLHPAEASHGDLGMITAADIVIAFSWSGETKELSDVLSYCGRFKVPLAAVTSGIDSSLAVAADIVLSLPQVEEACPNRLAPTSSTTLISAIGDALAVALIEVRGFSSDDFRVFHPKGQLGAQLLRVGDLMSGGDLIPCVRNDVTVLAAMLEMSLKRFGITAVVDGSGQLIGAFSDGDLRRTLTVASIDTAVADHMTARPLTLEIGQLASHALAVMSEHNVTQLFVNDGGTLVGIVHMHDILRAGVV